MDDLNKTRFNPDEMSPIEMIRDTHRRLKNLEDLWQKVLNHAERIKSLEDKAVFFQNWHDKNGSPTVDKVKIMEARIYTVIVLTMFAAPFLFDLVNRIIFGK